MAHPDLDALIDLHRPGVPLEDVARAVGISSSALRSLRTGLVARPHRATVAAIAKWLRCPIDRVRAAIAASHQLRGE